MVALRSRAGKPVRAAVQPRQPRARPVRSQRKGRR
jgi:hypothetical protein